MLTKKRGFTLIELLVVIAIIAILAAILFPVFAQAKLAAKGIAGVSNTKQIALGVIMYTNDYDDEWPLGEAWGESNAAFGFGDSYAPNNFLGFSPWSYTIFPYIKSAGLYIDPILGGSDGYVPDPSNPGFTQSIWDAYNTEFGYNWCLLNGGFWNSSGGVGSWPGFNEQPPVDVQFSTTTTSIQRPSDMVMITESPSHTDAGYTDGFYCFMLAGCSVLDMVEGPYCNSGISTCSDLSSYWGTSNGWAGLPDTAQGFIEGSDTSGVASRDHGLSITAFTDGHAKAMSLGALAVGTNWNPTLTKGQIQLTNKDTYRWWQY